MRPLATFAVGFLLLDAALLAWAGFDLGRPWLIAGAAVCLAAGVVVVLALRRYRRALAEVEQARREMKQQVDELRALLQEHGIQN